MKYINQADFAAGEVLMHFSDRLLALAKGHMLLKENRIGLCLIIKLDREGLIDDEGKPLAASVLDDPSRRFRWSIYG